MSSEHQAKVLSLIRHHLAGKKKRNFEWNNKTRSLQFTESDELQA